MPGDVTPRDDRAWPSGSLGLSAGLALVAAAGGVAATVAAADHGSAAVVWVAGSLVVAIGYGFVVALGSMRRWIAGRPASGRDLALLLAGFGAAFAALAGFGGRLGGAALGGLFAGVFLANLSAIRIARHNRALVDQAEAEQFREYELSRRSGAGPPRGTPPPIGPVLRAAAAGEQQRALAWLVAGALVTAAGAVTGQPARTTLVVARWPAAG